MKSQALRSGDGPGFGQRPLFHRTAAARAHVRVHAAEAPALTLHQSALVCGDACRALQLLPDACVQTVVTSPPCWSLRDYAVEDQIGRDDTLSDYIGSVVAAFEEVRRVLRDDGTVWLNVGDAFTSGNRRYRARTARTVHGRCRCVPRPRAA